VVIHAHFTSLASGKYSLPKRDVADEAEKLAIFLPMASCALLNLKDLHFVLQHHFCQ
jgi:hypothetical protein